MRKLFIYSSIVALALASGAVVSTAAAGDIPDSITLEGCGTKQPPVDFTHGSHAQKVECAVCHHTQADLTATAGEAATCVSCHKDPKDEAPSCAEMSPKKNPYHITCMGCHKDSVAKDASLKGKAPISCKECHKK